MKKFGFALSIFFLFAATAFASGVTAANNITESADVKIIIEGQMGEYKDVPIMASARIMLPLREVLTKLGVQNDDQHIIWDAAKRSVTVKKDDTVIYLEVGKTNGSVNGNEIAIDVAPIVYAKNNRTYMPARFVAESLGKEVVWDNSTRSVLIADKSSYNQVKDIITKSNAVMKDVKKYKFNKITKIKLIQDEDSVDHNVDEKAEVDQANKVFHQTTTSKSFGDSNSTVSEMYLKDCNIYNKNMETGKWQKVVFCESAFEDFFPFFNEVSNFEDADVNINILCAGMVLGESKNSDEIVLKGNVLDWSFMNKGYSGITIESFKDYGISKFYLELIYDKNTYLAKARIINFSSNLNDGGVEFDIKVNTNMSDYNGNFDIEIPQDAISNSDVF